MRPSAPTQAPSHAAHPPTHIRVAARPHARMPSEHHAARDMAAERSVASDVSPDPKPAVGKHEPQQGAPTPTTRESPESIVVTLNSERSAADGPSPHPDASPEARQFPESEQPAMLAATPPPSETKSAAEAPDAPAKPTPTPKRPAPAKPLEVCPNCQPLYQQNERLQRQVARLRVRLRDSMETAQTHGQRLLRAAFQDKLREMSTEHAHKTTEMLNIQKKCFEDELEAMESDTHAAISALQKELSEERDARHELVRRFEHERDDALQRTDDAMKAVQRKLAQLHARATRLEREKSELSAAHGEKQVMIEVLASAAAAKDVERRRLDVLQEGHEKERQRKNHLIDSLQAEVAELRERLACEVEQNQTFAERVAAIEGERRDDVERHTEDMADCKRESKREIDRMGRLFATVIQDFANVQSDVSTND